MKYGGKTSSEAGTLHPENPLGAPLPKKHIVAHWSSISKTATFVIITLMWRVYGGTVGTGVRRSLPCEASSCEIQKQLTQ